MVRRFARVGCRAAPRAAVGTAALTPRATGRSQRVRHNRFEPGLVPPHMAQTVDPSAHGGHAIRAAIRVYPCLSVPLPCGSAHTLPARRQAAPSQPTTPAMVRQGRAPHLSSLTVSVRPSSSVPWNFSMAACASCALQKRTRPYPCRRASPAVSALLAQTGSAEGRDRQCWSFAAPGHASVAVETECSVCTASQQRKHFAKHHAGCRRLPHQERAPC